MKLLYRIYQFCIAAPLLIGATILTAIITMLGTALGNAHFWGYTPGKLWSRFFCWILLLPVKVTGQENVDTHTSYVFVANHQGVFDIFLIYGYLGRNFKWMMKKSLRNLPFVGQACEAAGHIFVDNSGPKKIAQTISQARNTLQHGTSLVVFPEGRRTETGQMGTFKKGAFTLAQELQLPIVPMTINGSFQVLPRTRGFINFVSWHPLTLTIHAPIQPQEDLKATMDQAKATIENALT